MGNYFSPIVAELVSDAIFQVIDDKFKNNIEFMTKYVDDSLFIIPDHIFYEIYDQLNN